MGSQWLANRFVCFLCYSIDDSYNQHSKCNHNAINLYQNTIYASIVGPNGQKNEYKIKRSKRTVKLGEKKVVADEDLAKKHSNEN